MVQIVVVYATGVVLGTLVAADYDVLVYRTTDGEVLMHPESLAVIRDVEPRAGKLPTRLALKGPNGPVRD